LAKISIYKGVPKVPNQKFLVWGTRFLNILYAIYEKLKKSEMVDK